MRGRNKYRNLRSQRGTVKYRPDIDGLRSIAVLSVVFYHFQLFPILKGGFVGVDVFYVISGFLITSIIGPQIDNKTFALKQFYLARIRRLAPSLFATLFIVFC